MKGGERTIKTDRSRERERERRRRKDKFPAVFDRKARRRRKGGARRRHESALLGLWPQRERERKRGGGHACTRERWEKVRGLPEKRWRKGGNKRRSRMSGN